MNIDFNPGVLSLNEARGLVALLLAMHGGEVMPKTAPVNLDSLTINVDATRVTEALQASLAETFGDPQSTAGVPVPPDTTQPSVPASTPVLGAPVPSTTGTNATTVASPSSHDSAGLPWDERIHSSSKALKGDGTWRYRQGVSEDTKRAVEAELRGGPQPIAPPPPPPPPAPAAPAIPQPPSSPAPIAPTPPPAPSVSPTVAAPSTMPEFIALVQRATALQGAGKVTLDVITLLAQEAGREHNVTISSLSEMREHPAIIAAMGAKLAPYEAS